MTPTPLLRNLLTQLQKYLGRFQFKESITGLSGCDTTYLPIAIFDLNRVRIPSQGKQIELRSIDFGESADTENPSIASFVIEHNIGYHNNAFFLKDMRGNLKQQASKPAIVIDEPALLLPYYTTHFGHFTGDCLGAIISLSHAKTASNRKLFFVAPHSFEKIITKYGNPSVLRRIDSKLAHENNLLFTNACLLPRLSAWQNLSLCSQIFGNVHAPLPFDDTPLKKVFLTSGRPTRIANIKEVIEFLKAEGFYICRPDQVSFEQCLAILRDADLVISENGSITHNILISRNKPFYILSSACWNHLSPEEFAGGGIYNAYKSYLTHYIECKTTDAASYHAFSSQIIVHLADLKNLL